MRSSTSETNKNTIKNLSYYDRSTIWVIVIASICIALSLLIMGGVSYIIAEKAVINKLKSKDLFNILESVSEKVEGRISRGKETSLLIAQDPFLNRWVTQEETDSVMREMAEAKLKHMAEKFDYSSTFVVSNTTRNYWSERGLFGIVSETNPNDDWFFHFLNTKKTLEINIDYNQQRDNTYVFINALMGSAEQPLGIAGVGLDLNDIALEFSGFTSGHGNLWLTDRTGRIQLAGNLEERGKQLGDYLPAEINKEILNYVKNHASGPAISEYYDSTGDLIDIAYTSLETTDWLLVLQIPRTQTIGFLQSIKINTIIAAVISLLAIVLVFFLISNRIADPLKRAIRLSQELENKVEERTRELKEQNEMIMDSIDYAQKLQQTIIPSESQVKEMLPDSFVIWKPRDVVGGDFYWLDKRKDTLLIALGDCTGHGVPGALMTMAVVPLLKHIVDELGHHDPGQILKELSIRLRAAHQKDENAITDDGLDLGLCILQEDTIRYAGAKIDLYIKTPDKVEIVKGDRKSIGYQRDDSKYEFTTVSLQRNDQECIYMTTDGILDQNGGPKNYSFGRKRFISIIENTEGLSLEEQGQLFVQTFETHKGNQPQRDDLAVIGFSLMDKA